MYPVSTDKRRFRQGLSLSFAERTSGAEARRRMRDVYGTTEVVPVSEAIVAV